MANVYAQGARLRDACLEPWGGGLAGVVALALRVGSFAHTCAWTRQRDHLPRSARPSSIGRSGWCSGAPSP